MSFKKEKKNNSIGFNFSVLIKVSTLVLLLLSFNNSFSQKKFKERMKYYEELMLNAKETTNEVFVVTKDSIKHSGTKLKYPSIFLPQNHIKIDGVKYERKKLKDIISYQDEEAYVVYNKFSDVDAYRFVKGKINLYKYSVTVLDGSKYPPSYIYFLFERDNERFNFMDGSFDNIEALFADKKSVIDKFHEMYPESVRKNRKFPNANKNSNEYEWVENIVILTQMYNKQ